MNSHISLRRRLHYFDVCVTPTILFALPVFPLHQSHLQALDVLQRKMLRRIIGWRMLQDESWKDVMAIMKDRFARAQCLYYSEPWSMRFARNQWRYINHLLRGSPLLWSRSLCKYNWSSHIDSSSSSLPQRRQGRPRMRWDDNIHKFCQRYFPDQRYRHWVDDVLVHVDMQDFEDEFVIFLCADAE